MEHNSTILIVDDETDIRDTLALLLSDEGYKIDFAISGEEALEKANEHTPDLILMDIMMPDMDGFEACRRLRTNIFLAEVPIIILTGLGDRDSRLRGIDSGADDFLTKPFDRTELLARVRTITRLNRYRKLESKINRLSAVYDISSALNSSIDIDALLEFIIQQIKELLNVDVISILFYDQQKGELYFHITLTEDMSIESKLEKLRFSVEQGIAGWVVREGKPALVPDVNVDENFYGDIDKSIGFVTKSVLCVPLRDNEGVFGALEAVNKKDGVFTKDDQVLLEAMAGNIAVAIEKASLHKELQKAEALLNKQDAKLKNKRGYRFEDIIGKSDEIRYVIKQAEQVAITGSTVLIYGETGTGKELIAQAIHYGGPRMLKNFVAINCGAIPENLLESELFGHEKGAFTNAITRQIGRFVEANGGTLFLDEIGDMPLNLQVKLLRAIEDGVIRPLGSNQDTPVNVRLIAASQKDLAKQVADGSFRQDLYYRLKVFTIELPPLCRRRKDIPLLINHFIKIYNEKLGKYIVATEDEAQERLYQYDYPGNVRELQHIIESAMVVSKGETLTFNALPKEIRNSIISATDMVIEEKYITIPKNDEELKAAKAEAQKRVEQMFLIKLLTGTRGNVSLAARKANMNRSWLSQLVSKHQLDLSQFRKDVN
jgi:formate hydrogenlyase transcriptional activator